MLWCVLCMCTECTQWPVAVSVCGERDFWNDEQHNIVVEAKRAVSSPSINIGILRNELGKRETSRSHTHTHTKCHMSAPDTWHMRLSGIVTNAMQCFIIGQHMPHNDNNKIYYEMLVRSAVFCLCVCELCIFDTRRWFQLWTQSFVLYNMWGHNGNTVIYCEWSIELPREFRR